MKKLYDRKAVRVKKHARMRDRLKGTAARPRLAVCRSSRHIYAQIIDDSVGRTLCSASTQTVEVTGTKTDAARLVGEAIAKKALEQDITKVVFDRGGNLYHGRIKALADGARAAGLDF